MCCQRSTALDVNTMIYRKLLNFTPDAWCQHWLAAAYLQLTWPRQNRRVSNVKSTITRDASTSSTWSAQWANNGIFNMQRLMVALIFRRHQQPTITSLKDWENPGKFLPLGAKEPTNRTRIPLTPRTLCQTASKSYVLVQVCWKLSLQLVALFTNGRQVTGNIRNSIKHY